MEAVLSENNTAVYIIKLKIQCWPVTVHGGLHWLATPPHPPLDQPIQASIAYVDLFY